MNGSDEAKVGHTHKEFSVLIFENNPFLWGYKNLMFQTFPWYYHSNHTTLYTNTRIWARVPIFPVFQSPLFKIPFPSLSHSLRSLFRPIRGVENVFSSLLSLQSQLFSLELLTGNRFLQVCNVKGTNLFFIFFHCRDINVVVDFLEKLLLLLVF